MSRIDNIVFDKTETITNSGKSEIHWEGETLNQNEVNAIFSLIKLKTLSDKLKSATKTPLSDFEETMKTLSDLFPKGTQLVFNQKPQDKLNYIRTLQKSGRKVLMIGNGLMRLNDARVLKQSDAGVAASDDINNFSAAFDGILDGSKFQKFKTLL